MKQEEKDLLLQDLSSRLPYGVKCDISDSKPYTLSSISDDCDGILIRFKERMNGFDAEHYLVMEVYLSEIKPYLFPLSSMTEEQKQNLKNRFCYDWDGEPYDLWNYQIEIGDADELIDWFHENHIDYRCLIEKGLAIDATNLNIY